MSQKGTESQRNCVLYQEPLQKPAAELGMALLTYASPPSLLKHSSPQKQRHLLPAADLLPFYRSLQTVGRKPIGGEAAEILRTSQHMKCAHGPI